MSDAADLLSRGIAVVFDSALGSDSLGSGFAVGLSDGAPPVTLFAGQDPGETVLIGIMRANHFARFVTVTPTDGCIQISAFAGPESAHATLTPVWGSHRSIIDFEVDSPSTVQSIANNAWSQPAHLV